VGDIMLGTDFPQNILPDDDGVGFLAGVTPFLSAPDVAFGNLEGVLQDGGEPVKQCKDTRICFLFRTPTRYAAYLARAGFDVMSLANNHARDFGETGRSSSMAALDAVGIRHSGREGTTASWIANGRRVALVAFAPNVGSNSLNDPQIGVPLVTQLAATHDIVIVSFHGGAEGNGAEVLPFAREIFAGEDRGDVVQFAHAMVDAGADLVLGHGPHVVRAMELYRDRLIAYSLGNFATYYGISVEGNRGIAPILLCSLDDEGRFVSGRIQSTVQIRPAGPSTDPANAVIDLLRTLTQAAFPDGALDVREDGSLARRSAQ
jgi:poly-gamma-glutamate capsule biosynthesis protein CapA/YwtB (metallophosphatase superfamily)